MAARATRAKLLIEITLPNLSSKFLFEVSLRNFSLKFLFEISLIIATVIFSRSPCTSATFPKKTRGEGFIWRKGANALRLLFMKITCYFHARRYHAHLIFYWCLYDEKLILHGVGAWSCFPLNASTASLSAQLCVLPITPSSVNHRGSIIHTFTLDAPLQRTKNFQFFININ